MRIKLATAATFAALVLAAPAFAQSGPGMNTRGGGAGAQMRTGPGASEFAPGQQRRTNATGPGASQFAPGQQPRTNATGPGASQFAPGQRARVGNTMRSRTTQTNRTR